MQMTLKSVLSHAIVFSALAVSATESTWLGMGGDNKWTNAGNWSNGVPGLLTDGTGAKGDTATFTSVDDGAATTIDLDGLKSIGKLIVTGAAAPIFTFGTDKSQLLGLEKAAGATYSTSGLGICVEATVTAAPVVVATLSLTDAVTRNADYFFVANHSADTMTIGDFGYPQRANVDGQYFSLAGNGPFLVTGAAVGSPTVTYDNVALAIFGAGRVTIDNPTGESTARFVKMAGDGNHEMYLPEGMTWKVVDGKFDFQVEGTARIHGDGKIQITGSTSCYFQKARYNAVSVEVPLVSTRTLTSRLYTFYGNGTVALESVTSQIKGPVALQAAATSVPLTLAVKALGGAADLPSSLGPTADPILFAANGVVKYTGSGETSPRGFRFINRISSTYAYDGVMALENAGTGPWVLTGVIDAETGAAATGLTLKGDSASPATLAAALADFQKGVPFTLAKEGAGTWKLTGQSTNTGTTSVNAGTLEFGDGATYVSPIALAANAVLKISPNATVSLGTVTASGAAVLELGSGSSLTIAEMSDEDYAKLTVVARPGASLVKNGQPVALDTGMIEIKDGETRTENIVLDSSSANQTVYQSGGTMNINAADSQTSFPQISYCGFWSMTGGAFTQTGGGIVTLPLNANSAAMYRQSGGVTKVNKFNLCFSNNGASEGEMVVSGGTMDVVSRLAAPGFRYDSDAIAKSGVRTTLTVEGAGRLTSTNETVFLRAKDTSIVNVNLNGGTFTTKTLQRYANAADSNKLYVNFNGGTLDFENGDANPFGKTSDKTCPDRITVYAGGATVYLSRTIYAPAYFRAPSGKGVASVPMPTAPCPAYAITQPPIITITGDGCGASAVCDWDWTTCTYSAPRIVCPGSGYEDAATATFDWGYVNGVRTTTTAVCVLTEATPVSGGLTKKGPGTLTLFGADTPGANDFGGPLVIEQGDVRLYNNALAGGKTVILKGGSLSIATGATAPALNWQFTLGETASATNMDAQFPTGSTVVFDGTIDENKDEYVLATFKSITGVPTLTNALPKGWKFKVTGTKLSVKKIRGIILVFR